MLRAGHSYEAIARQERLSRERIRQIVKKSLETEKGATLPDQNRVQMARLEPALRLAAIGVENGDLKAIPHLLRVLDRLDKCGSVVKAEIEDYAVIHERLMAKINAALARDPKDHAAWRARTSNDAASPPLAEAAEAGVQPKENLQNRESAESTPLSP
jgi:hypothetical protein